MKVLVTGASGYIGTALCQELADKGHFVKGIGRTKVAPSDKFEYVSFDLEGGGVYELVKEYDCIVHLAGRAHILGDAASQSFDIYRQTNSDLTIRLAKAAIKGRVRRFIFISSIGVNGSLTHDHPFSEISLPAPQTPYAMSKYTAEKELQVLFSGSAVELVIIRPPLVYAGNAPGNFLRLMKLVSTGLPLPFGAVKNSRSMIALENLVDLIQVCMIHPAAAGELFLASDNHDFSTAEIVGCLARGMNKNVILLPFGGALMRLALSLLGKKSIYSQLYGSLKVDSSKARHLLGWTPPRDARQCLIKAGSVFKSNIEKIK